MAEQMDSNQVQAQGAVGGAGLASLIGQAGATGVSEPQPGDGATPHGTGQGAAPMTRAELEAWQKQVLETAERNAERKAQSMIDAALARQEKQRKDAERAVRAQIKEITDNGGSVPEAMQRKMLDDALANAGTNAVPQSDPSTGSTGSPTAGSVRTVVEKPEKEPPVTETGTVIPAWAEEEADALVRQYGQGIDPGDPEAAGLDAKLLNENPLKFLRQYEAALKAKAERVGAGQAGGDPSTGSTGSPTAGSVNTQVSRAATPGIGTGGQRVDLTTTFIDEMVKAQGDKYKMREIKARYQAQGLDVDSAVQRMPKL